MSFLEIKNLNKNFGKQSILKDINLSIKEGDLVVFLGASGCGKSTLLNCIAGLLKFDSGDIFMEGQNMNEMHPSQRDIAMVFQSYALFPNMNVWNNISFGMKIRKKSKEEIKVKIKEVAEMLNIHELLHRKPSQLSGGQQQRVAIGRALVRNPHLFLFDEPLSNLDAKLRAGMRTRIKRLNHTLKTTMIYVTHDQIEAMTLATYIAVMNQGRIVQYGTPQEIYFTPANLFVARFVGSPPMNIISATLIKNKKNKKYAVEIKLDRKKYIFTLPLTNKNKDRYHTLSFPEDFLDQEVKMGIRPENIYFNPLGKHPNREWQIPIGVDLIEPTGSDNLVVLNFQENEIICRLHNEISLPKLGAKNKFYFDLNQALLYDPQSENRIW